jgi:dTDP-glucose 4,6-dehydratase
VSNPLHRDLDEVLAHTAAVWPRLRGQRVFLTGGTGFVGKWLLETLIWANERLDSDISAVVLTRDPERFRRYWPHLADHPKVQLWHGDVRFFDYPPSRFTFVVHAATERYVEPSPENPVSTLDRDLEGTRRVLDFTRACGAERFLFTSSGAVYGEQPADLARVSEDYAGAPVTTEGRCVYGHAKRISELMAVMYAQQYGFAAVIARLFAFVGPYLPLDANFAVGNFIRDALNGGPVRIAGDGTPCRSYMYGADLAAWLWAMLVFGESGRPYNVGSPAPVTITDLALAVVSATVPGTPIEIAGGRNTGVFRYVPSTERAETELGMRATVGLEKAVQRTCEWHCLMRAAGTKARGGLGTDVC